MCKILIKIPVELVRYRSVTIDHISAVAYNLDVDKRGWCKKWSGYARLRRIDLIVMRAGSYDKLVSQSHKFLSFVFIIRVFIQGLLYNRTELMQRTSWRRNYRFYKNIRVTIFCGQSRFFLNYQIQEIICA